LPAPIQHEEAATHAKEANPLMDAPDPAAPGGKTAHEQLADQSDEQRRILSWRYRQIRGLGFGRLETRLLAESNADLAVLRKLIGDGCPPPLAFRIAF
jgi:hypothetical protein